MAADNSTTSNSLQSQEARLLEIHKNHIARLQESGILQKAQRAYAAEYNPLPSGGGRAGLKASEPLRAEQFAVSHAQDGDATDHIMIMKDEYHPIIVGTITSVGGSELKIEANQKRGFNTVDVKSVASMVKELVELKQSGELSGLSDDLQRIEKQTTGQSTTSAAAPLTQPISALAPQVESSKSEISLEEAIQLLSYSDVLPEQHRKDAVDAIKKGEATMDYARELVELYAVQGRPKVEELARGMVEFCGCVLKQKNIPPTMYAPSISWALWDIAKQSYLAKHPDKSSPEYLETLESPFALTPRGDRKRIEIRERHIGWEVMRRWDQGEVKAGNLPLEAQQILTTGQRNETSQLKSYELAKLGHIVSESVPAKAC